MVTFILHTHLPYVLHHGTWPHGSDWLCEAVAECYLPLLKMCDRLLDDGIRPGITFDISPVLCEQLRHPDFPELFEEYCARIIRGWLVKTQNTSMRMALQILNTSPHFGKSGTRIVAKSSLDVYDSDIVGAFKRLQDEGAIEMMTCAVSPTDTFRCWQKTQVLTFRLALAVENFKRHFGKPPRGMWLPECAYRPSYPWRTYLPVGAYAVAKPRMGVEEIVRAHNVEFFVTDQGALRRGDYT